jgi:hypothetical protein
MKDERQETKGKKTGVKEGREAEMKEEGGGKTLPLIPPPLMKEENYWEGLNPSSLFIFQTAWWWTTHQTLCGFHRSTGFNF